VKRVERIPSLDIFAITMIDLGDLEGLTLM
jgi:hypothetical protein